MRFAPDCALDDEIVTIRPHPAAIMSGIADWMQWNVPVRFTSIIRLHPSGVMSVNDSNRSNPALVTMISIGPSSARTFAMAASTAGRSLTSTAIPMAVAPVARNSLAALVAASASRSSSATLLPCAARRWAEASPMPDAPPVTTATRDMTLPPDLRIDPSMEDPPKKRKLPLKKRECHCHSRQASPRVGIVAVRRKGNPVRIGLMIGPERGRYRERVARLVEAAQPAEQAGFASIWVPQIPNDF